VALGFGFALVGEVFGGLGAFIGLGGTFSSTWTWGLGCLGGGSDHVGTRGLLSPWDLTTCLGVLRGRIRFIVLQSPTQEMRLKIN
jgi:hypothetical protein